MFYTWTIGNKELKLKLNTQSLIMLEKKIGCNPLDIFMAVEEGKLPTITVMAEILHASLQAMEHGYNLMMVYNLLDEYFAEGGTIVELMPIIIEIFKVSGFFKIAG